MHFCRSCFSTMVSFRYVLVFLGCFCCYFLSNKYYLMLLNLKRYLFSAITIFLSMRNVRNKIYIFKSNTFRYFHQIISCFMKCPWNCALWNALREKFLSVSLPLVRTKKKCSASLRRINWDEENMKNWWRLKIFLCFYVVVVIETEDILFV